MTLAVLLLAAVGPLACVPTGRLPASQEVVREYRKVHQEGTRELKLYRQLETRLLLRATWLDLPWRRAAVELLARQAALSEPERAALLAQELARAEERYEVVFAAMRTEPELREFGGGPDSPWRVRLDVAGQPCELLAITRIEEPSPSEALLFPQGNAWADLWRAEWSKACGAEGTATLTVSSAAVSGAVTWPLLPPR